MVAFTTQAFYGNKHLPTNREFEWVVVKRLGAFRGDADGSTELQSSGMILGDWVGLDDDDVVFLERPWLECVS